MRIIPLLAAVVLTACTDRPIAGSDVRGNYVVEPPRPAKCKGDRHGSSGQLAQRIFYKGRLLTAEALSPIFSPHNPERLLYTVVPACASNEAESGSFYFDGMRAAPVKAHPLGLQDPPKDFDHYWAPDDRYVVITSDEGKELLFNLQSGEYSLYLSELFKLGGLMPPNVTFRGWSPDGAAMALETHALLRHRDGDLFWRTKLMSVNPDTLVETNIGELDVEHWDARWFTWTKRYGRYVLAESSPVR